MKKHLIAAAVAAAVAVPAAAQVTVSGNMDIAQSQTKVTDTNSGNNLGRTAQSKSSTILGNGGDSPYSSSMLMFQATEDLGQGLKAFATHEITLRNTGDGPGHTGSLGASRQSFVGISGGFGSLTIGYQYAHEHNVLNGAGNAGTNNTIGTMQNLASLGKLTRHDMIQWTSPKLMGGLELVAQYGKDEGEDTRSDRAPNRNASGSDYGALGFNYAAGALTLRGGWSQQEFEQAAVPTVAVGDGLDDSFRTRISVLGRGITIITAAGNAVAANAEYDVKADIDRVYIGGNYNFGAVQLFANYADRDGKTSGTANGARINEVKVDTKGYDIGVRIPLGATMLWASIGDGEVKTAVAGAPNYQADTSGYQVGAYYAMSKRTGLYALMGKAEIDETTAAQTAANTAQKTKATAYAVGVRHSF